MSSGEKHKVRCFSRQERWSIFPQGLFASPAFHDRLGNVGQLFFLWYKISHALGKLRLAHGKLNGVFGIENKKVVIDEETAEVVRYIFEQYSLGVYVKDIIINILQF